MNNKKNINGMTLAELILASSLAMIVIGAVGALWLLFYNSYLSEDRTTDVRTDLVAVLATLDKDISYYAIGSQIDPALEGLHFCSAEGGCAPNEVLRIRYDSNNNLYADPLDGFISYSFDTAEHTITKASGGKTHVLSERIVTFEITPNPKDSKKDFLADVHIKLRYDPSKEPHPSENPELEVYTTIPAYQVSVR